MYHLDEVSILLLSSFIPSFVFVSLKEAFLLVSDQWKDKWMDRQTMDGQMDTPSYTDAWSHKKKNFKNIKTRQFIP